MAIFQRLWNSPTITTWFSFFTKALRLVVVLPLVLSLLPSNEVTVYFLFFAVGTIGRSLTLAFSTTYIRSFAYAWRGAKKLEGIGLQGGASGEPNESLLRDTYGTITVIQWWIATIVVVTLSTVGVFLLAPYIGQIQNPGLGWVAWGVQIGVIWVNVWTSREASLLFGIGQVARANRVGAFFSILTVGMIWLALTLGYGLVGLSVAGLIGGGVSFARVRYLAWKTCPMVLRAEQANRWQREVFDCIWRPSWKQLIIVLSTTGMVQASGFVLGMTSSGVALVSYLLALRLMSQVSEISRAPFYSRIPNFSGIRAEDNTEKLARVTGSAMQRCIIVFALGAVAVPLGIPVLLELVDSKTPFVDSGIWLLMCFVWLIERHQGMHAQVVLTQNKVPFVVVTLVTGILHLTLMLWLGRKFGAYGLVMAHGISNLLIMSWLAPVLSWKSLGVFWKLNVKGYWKGALAMLIFMSLTVPFVGRVGEFALQLLGAMGGESH